MRSRTDRVALLAASVALLALGAGLAALILDDEPASLSAVGRPSTDGGVTAGPTPTSYAGRARLEAQPVTPSVRPPKQSPRTVESLSAEIVESSDAPATKLSPSQDPSADGGAHTLFANSLVNEGAALWIAEPHVASKGDRVLVTWNHGAAFSSNGGTSFTLVSRDEIKRGAGGYCCDQVVLYEPSRDLWIWFVQGENDANEHNVVRIGVANGDTEFDNRSFENWTFGAESFGELLRRVSPGLSLSETSLDYPNIALTRRHLYLAINVYHADTYENTVVMRIALDDLAAGRKDLAWRYVASGRGTAQLVDGATDTMYFAHHVDTTTLRIWRWRDDEPDPSTTDVPHSGYSIDLPGYSCRRIGAVSGDWCKRLKGTSITNDDRVSAGWITEHEIGFSWNANGDPARGFPFPFVMVTRFDPSSLALKDEPHIWSPDHAYQYAAISPNARGDLGGVVIAGGGSHYWTCASVIRDDASEEQWDARALDVSDADALRDETGDYLGATPHDPGGNTWVGTCMTLDGGGQSTDVQVRLYHFGRADQND